MELLDGKTLAKAIRQGLKLRIAALVERGRTPGLAVVLVGEDEASQVYVGTKERSCKRLGFHSVVRRVPAEIGQEALLAEVRSLNADPAIHGILVQMPLPVGYDEDAVLSAIDPVKDVDGLTPTNLGLLLRGQKGHRCCTPKGVMCLLDDAGIELKGKRAVIVGRSVLVGKPLAFMLLERHCTVTLCHSRTVDLADEVGRADVLVVATGKPEMVPGQWVKEGAVVVDVGINRVDDGLVGDVDFQGAAMRASYITPVPGGVGPMTVAMLMENTVEACERLTAEERDV